MGSSVGGDNAGNLAVTKKELVESAGCVDCAVSGTWYGHEVAAEAV